MSGLNQRFRGLGLVAALLGGGLLGAPAGHAQETGIAAVVNDDIVSVGDVQARMRLAIVSLAIDDTPEARKRLLPTVLRGLIDEKLQMQEAKRLSVTVSEAELDRAIGDLEAANGLPKGGFPEVMKRAGVEYSTLQDQIRTNVAWVKVVRRSAGAKGEVTKDEVDEAIARQTANHGKPEFRVAEIFLAVDNPQADPEVRQTAERLIDQIRGGANFQAVARQFSQNAAAATGGDLGWLMVGQQPAEVDSAIARMQMGEVAGPIRSAAGYHIVALLARRVGGREEAPPPTPAQPPPPAAAPGSPPIQDARLSLYQVVLGLSPQANKAEVDKIVEQARSATAKAKTCKDMEAIGKKIGTALSGPLKNIKLSNLPVALRTEVDRLQLGQKSPPLPAPDGIMVLMVCERENLAPAPASAAATPPPPPRQAPPEAKPGGDEPIGGMSEAAKRKRVEDSLVAQKMEQLAQRMLRDLRRSAFLEVRQ